MFSQGSSTSAAGHSGTGVGVHDRSWPHYIKPAKGNTRDTHTYYDFNEADELIKSHKEVSGDIFMPVIKYKKIKGWKCSNCGKVINNKNELYNNNCTTGDSRHKYNEAFTWDNGTSTKASLFFDKRGQQIQVSYHKF